MTADVTKVGDYVIYGGQAEIQSAQTYAVVGGQAMIRAATTYAVLSPQASITSAHTYAVISPQSAVNSAHNYAVLRPRYLPFSASELSYPFINQRFPECISFGSTGGPGFKTSVFEVDSGLTSRIQEWSRLRAQYTVTFENATPEDMEELEDFFYGMHGQAIGFRFKDWLDYQIASQNVFIGDGVTKVFQIFKRYESGGYIYDRLIKKTVPLTMELKLDGVTLTEGVDFYVIDDFGLISMVNTPAAGAVGQITYLEFDVPVRFSTDSLNISKEVHENYGVSSLPLVEVLV